MEEYLAEIRHLKIEYETEYGRVHAVNDVSFPIYPGNRSRGWWESPAAAKA